METNTTINCPHPLTEANCLSGSFREIDGARIFIPMPSVCENCKLHACDDCAESWPGTCVSCGSGLCGNCASSARSRRVTGPIAYGAPYRTHTEFLCAKCAAIQDAALAKVLETMHSYSECTMPKAAGTIWLSDVIDELKEAVQEAARAL